MLSNLLLGGIIDQSLGMNDLRPEKAPFRGGRRLILGEPMKATCQLIHQLVTEHFLRGSLELGTGDAVGDGAHVLLRFEVSRERPWGAVGPPGKQCRAEGH